MGNRPKPLALTDAELTAIFQAARPLRVCDRDGFLQEVASALASCTEIGPGAVNRAVRSAQKKFFDPPQLGNAPGAISKYR